jgi:hypothetical protein
MKIGAYVVLSAVLISLQVQADAGFTAISRERVLSAGPEWQEKYDAYQPAPETMEALKTKLGSDLRIDIYLGLWCSDSKNNVPPFIKILDQLGIGMSVRYLSVPRKPSPKIKYFADDAQVERVPTFIFSRGDKEIGRIIENPKAGLIEDFLEVLEH